MRILTERDPVMTDSGDLKQLKDMGSDPYTLPKATANTLGGVKIGEGVNISNDGTISVESTPIGGNNGVIASCSRWLRFDPENKKGVVIKGGTTIYIDSDTYVSFATDTAIDLSEQITTPGANYYLFLASDGTVTATTTTADGRKIGRFHTLCVDAGTMTMIVPTKNMVVGDSYPIKPYTEDDADFLEFYTKEISAVTTNTIYDVATVEHPLSGYSAGDILPESIFCLTFFPHCLYDDAMVYDKNTDSCIDVYMQSGTELNTRSAYNATRVDSRAPINHIVDFSSVGKRLLSDLEFTSAAIGSNQKTAIAGETDPGTVGGHSDTTGRRMISAIGCEDMCGYLWQWLDVFPYRTGSSWGITDGVGAFGSSYTTFYVLAAGGHYSLEDYMGSMSRTSESCSTTNDDFTCRGACETVKIF